jgi:hypothetical protein
VRALWVVIVVGCRFSDGVVPGDGARHDGVPLDAPAEAMPDAFVFQCSTATLDCPNPFLTQLIQSCNGACWVSCQSNDAIADEATAAMKCANWGGELAPLRDVNDQACVHQGLFDQQASWIGFVQDPLATMKAAGWSWNSDGQTPGFTQWAGGQPNDADGTESGQEQCAVMSTGGDWQDVPCTGQTYARFSCRH